MNYETTVDASTGSAFVEGDPLAEVEREERTDRRRWWLIAAAAAVVLAIAVFLVTRGGSSDLPADDQNQAPAITVVVPGRTTIEGTITATGSLAARREMPIGVVDAGGRVVSVPVDAGQWVSAGQILAVIDRSVQTQQALSAKANIDVAKSDAELAQANLDRSLQLVARGFISKADIDRNRDLPSSGIHDADRHFAPRGEGTGGGNRAFDRRPAGNHHGDRRRLVLIVGGQVAAAPAGDEEHRDREHDGSRGGDQPPAPAIGPLLAFDLGQRIAFDKGAPGAGVDGRLVVHSRQDPEIPPLTTGVLHQYTTADNLRCPYCFYAAFACTNNSRSAGEGFGPTNASIGAKGAVPAPNAARPLPVISRPAPLSAPGRVGQD